MAVPLSATAIVTAWVTAASLLLLTLMAADKRAARRRRRRIRERTLLLWSIAGGGPGGLVAMNAFRHKTRNKRFRITYGITAMLWTASILWAWTRHNGM